MSKRRRLLWTSTSVVNMIVKVVKKLLQFCKSMWPNHECTVDISEPPNCLWSAVSIAISYECFINMWLTTGDSDFPIPMPSFCWLYVIVKLMSSNPITFKFAKAIHIKPVLYDVWDFSTGTLVAKLPTSKPTRQSRIWRWVSCNNFINCSEFFTKESVFFQMKGSESYWEIFLRRNRER
jgi:hypothetical protein